MAMKKRNPAMNNYPANKEHMAMTNLSNMTTMVTSLIATFALASVAVTGFAGLAQADSWDCAMPIARSGCAVLIHKPLPQLPQPEGE
jgi:hypothetical protein